MAPVCVLIFSQSITDVLARDAVIVGVTILLSLTVFLQLVAETMPPTSDAVPLIGVSQSQSLSCRHVHLKFYWNFMTKQKAKKLSL